MLEQQIFISHSSKDNAFAKKLYQDLLSEGYWVWMDPDLKEATKWKPQIEDNLEKSNRFIVLISSHSVRSKWVIHEGSMAYAFKQHIIPIRIEASGNYTSADLPVWIQETQLFNMVEGGTDYQNQFKRLQQLLGEPFPIQKHLEEMVIHYKISGMLLSEVALDLIEKHKAKIEFPPGSEELIENSRRALQDYWTRYERLKRDYEKATTDNYNLRKGFEIHLVVLVVLYLVLTVYVITVIIDLYSK